MTIRIHAAAGVVAMALIATFLLSTLVAELVGGDAVPAVRTAIVYALAVLVPCLIVAGGSGRALAAGRTGGLVRRKRRRTAVVAALGACVLVPCAVTLYAMAGRGDLGAAFHVVQGVELVAGTANLTLLALNARDGRRMAAGRRRTRSSDRSAGVHAGPGGGR